ncbi:hypothetical protein SASPL_153330 [Salvia splendens]|uniref:Thioredoxin domain-containing protein n=1 Tax=Salvia splendens TaxID=180675 RepID=A0A8X8W511_SALSN|nr:hypothetical protein SASPL_153330 [Salvia splendens]
MALRVYSAAPRNSVVQNFPVHGAAEKQLFVGGDCPQLMMNRRLRLSAGVRCSLDVAAQSAAVEAVAEVGKVTAVTKDTFWPIVKAAGDKTVVVDMYTQWCGPCKPLAKELGIKVVPTFKILKDSKIVKEVTGAKIDNLIHAIDSVRST